MFVAINFTEALEVPREEIEALILDALMAQGKDRAKVTGGGAGVDGSTIDLAVDDTLGVAEVLGHFRQALQASEDVPRNTEIQIEDTTYPLSPSEKSAMLK
jgi:hypothetical protein